MHVELIINKHPIGQQFIRSRDDVGVACSIDPRGASIAVNVGLLADGQVIMDDVLYRVDIQTTRSQVG